MSWLTKYEETEYSVKREWLWQSEITSLTKWQMFNKKIEVKKMRIKRIKETEKGIAKKMMWTWLYKGYLKRATESLAKAAQQIRMVK